MLSFYYQLPISGYKITKRIADQRINQQKYVIKISYSMKQYLNIYVSCFYSFRHAFVILPPYLCTRKT